MYSSQCVCVMWQHAIVLFYYLTLYVGNNIKYDIINGKKYIK